MTASAPRSIDEYLKQLREALAGEDPALIQDALYDAEEYLRAEVAANPEKTEADVLELIASTYGAPDEVAAAYRDTEAKVKAALQPPAPPPRRSPRARYAVFQRLLRLARLYLALLHAAVAGDRHRLLHVRRHGPLDVLRRSRPHHRPAVLPRLHRHDARDVARRRPTARGDDRRTHAAPARASRPQPARSSRASARCSAIPARGPRSPTSC